MISRVRTYRRISQKVAGCKKGAGVFMGEIGEEKFSKWRVQSVDCVDAASGVTVSQVVGGVHGARCFGVADVVFARAKASFSEDGGGDKPPAVGLKSRWVSANADSWQSFVPLAFEASLLISKKNGAPALPR